jgi:hypothetical protein
MLGAVIPNSADPLVLLVLLFIRGFLLWFLMPVGVVIWLVGAIWFVPRAATLGRFLAWVDNNFIIVLERTILRPFFYEPTHSWVRFADVSKITHRVRLNDLL